MAAPIIYRSTDGSAPVLHGNAGSLIAVLDGCLVNGYGAKAALGWAKAFTGTNLASYRAPAGVRHYLDVDDSGPDATAIGRNARVRGYEAMTAVATGTRPFPTTTQATAAVALVKSTTTGTTARPWLLIGDDRTFYLFAEAAGADPPNLGSHTWTTFFYFGEFLSVLSGDLYRSYLGWQSVTSTVVAPTTAALALMEDVTVSSAKFQCMPRSYTGAGASCWSATLGNGSLNTGSSGIPGGLLTVFPNPADGGLYLNNLDLMERGAGTTGAPASNSGVGFGGFRGRHRGLYQAPYTQAAGFNDQDTFSGLGDYTGRTFLILKLANVMFCAETTAWVASV